MDKKKLSEYLQTNTSRLYCVLDGAQVPDLPKLLYEMRPPNFCLLRGELEADMLHVAPYVCDLLPNSTFTDWVLNESFGKNWGIFAHAVIR